MNHRTNAKTAMLGHSQAKVELYGRYLSIYLNILSRVPFVDKIFIFDLLCGEGVYENGEEGSPCIALNAIKSHYDTNNQTCPKISIWFNDNGFSQIDEGIYKVDRVQKLCSERFIPPSVGIEYHHDDFKKIYLDALQQVQTKRNVKGLFFIDPYGYKAVKPQHIRRILECGNTEVILFLPASYMYRFAESSTQSAFPGGEVLRDFLLELFHSINLNFRSVYDFIEQMKNGFRRYLSQQKIFVDVGIRFNR